RRCSARGVTATDGGGLCAAARANRGVRTSRRAGSHRRAAFTHASADGLLANVCSRIPHAARADPFAIAATNRYGGRAVSIIRLIGQDGPAVAVAVAGGSCVRGWIRPIGTV